MTRCKNQHIVEATLTVTRNQAGRGKSYPYMLFLCCLFLLFLTSCESTAIYTSRDRTTPASRERGRNVGSSEYMVASWYGNQYHGRQTASGEIYNMYDFTAAHRTLPFGTRLRLINESNGKEVIVRINDRGPVPLERDIDVSYRTAQTLDFVNAGIVRLKVVYLE